MVTYKEQQRNHQEKLIRNPKIFDSAEGGGLYKNVEYQHILKNGCEEKNLYSKIRGSAINYFKGNHIKWWGGKNNKPTGNVLSSQVACVNHLFPIRENPKAVLEVAKTVYADAKDVLPICCDKYKTAYVSFEVVSKEDLLQEERYSRGASCTSIDAVILVKTKQEKNVLIIIEWKYTETYSKGDKSTEDRKGEEKGNMKKGKERQLRYNKLITTSPQLKTLPEYQGSVYYQEPFYQLMRQTLWAEQIIAHKDSETIKADDYIHVHVVPKGNKELLDKKYWGFGESMEKAWSSMLETPKKYKLIDPSVLCAPIDKFDHELYQYLEQRYWQQINLSNIQQ